MERFVHCYGFCHTLLAVTNLYTCALIGIPFLHALCSKFSLWAPANYYNMHDTQ